MYRPDWEEKEDWTTEELFDANFMVGEVPKGDPLYLDPEGNEAEWPLELEYHELPPEIKKMFDKEGWDEFREA